MTLFQSCLCLDSDTAGPEQCGGAQTVMVLETDVCFSAGHCRQ